MDAAIGNIFAPILDKLARQDSGDGMLFRILKEITGKYSIQQTRAIKQPDPQSRPNNPSNDQNIQNIFTEFKKLYRDILRDQSYKNDYKLFLKKILDRDLLESAGKKEQLDLIPGVDKPLLVVIDGLTKKGAEDFKDKLFKDLFKDLNVSLSEAIKKGFTSIKKDEKGLIEELLETIPDFSFGVPGFGGGGRDRRRRKAPRKKTPTRPSPGRRPGRGRVPIPPILPGSTPKPAPVPKGAPPLPTPKPAPVPKGAPGGGTGGMLGKVGGLLGKLALPLMTLYEAGTNLSDSITELSEKKTLSTGQKIGTGGMALMGGAADLVTTIFDPTSWGIDKMLGYDIFGEGLSKELLNVIGAKKEDQTMGESLRERATGMFESLNDYLENELKVSKRVGDQNWELIDLLPFLGGTVITPELEKKMWAQMSVAPELFAEGSDLFLKKITSPDSVTPEDMKKFAEKINKEYFNPDVEMAAGGIVTGPTRALIGEAGPEAVLPLDKYFNNDFNLNNTTLDQIAGNTKDTNKALGALAEAIVKMVTVFNQKMNTQGGTTIINSGGSQQTTSASMAANLNSDPIRRVRSQFMS